MKHKIAAIFTSLALVSSFAIAGQCQVQAAAETSYSKLLAITDKAYDDALHNELGVVCEKSDGLGNHRATTTYSTPPEDYTGSAGDLWKLIEPIELTFTTNHYFYWDGVEWLNGAPDEEGSDENKNHRWNLYAGDYEVMVRDAQESDTGYQCVFSSLKRIEIIGKAPAVKYSGQIGDLYLKMDPKFVDANLGYIWNGIKWIASLNNPYTLAHSAAIRSKVGEYCTYGANKDISTSYYATPPKSYKGVKGDLWITMDETYGNLKGMYYWSGKVWVPNNAAGFEQLQKINDAAQLKARSSAIGEVCHAGSNVTTQVITAKLPTKYKGKINDRWAYMDKNNTSMSIKMYYWNGKSWALD